MKLTCFVSGMLAVLFCTSSFPNFVRASDDPIQYRNRENHWINRWVLTEPMAAGRTLLLVIESDPAVQSQDAVSQTVIFRKSFDESDAMVLQSLIQYYFELSDLKMVSRLEPETLPAPGRPLWIPVKDTWNLQDEAAYSRWFSTQVETDFDQSSGLTGDCADMAMIFRWVYARNHHLPVANTMAGSGKLVGQFTSSAEWDKLPVAVDWKLDQRFKAGLKYALQSTFTHSVFNDLYPTEINSTYVHPGSIFIFLRQSGGHTQTIKAIGANPLCGKQDCIVTYWGNEPASTHIQASAILPPDVGSFGSVSSGFKTWRWPRNREGMWELTPSVEMPGYSLEQFHSPVAHPSNSALYLDWVMKQLGFSEAD